MVFSENLLRRTLSILSTNHGHFQKWIYSSCMNTENADCGLLTLVDSWPRSGFCLLHNKGFDWSRMRIVKPRKTSPLSRALHIKSGRHISDPRFQKDKQCAGKKMPESGHILAGWAERKRWIHIWQQNRVPLVTSVQMLWGFFGHMSTDCLHKHATIATLIDIGHPWK